MSTTPETFTRLTLTNNHGAFTASTYQVDAVLAATNHLDLDDLSLLVTGAAGYGDLCYTNDLVDCNRLELAIILTDTGNYVINPATGRLVTAEDITAETEAELDETPEPMHLRPTSCHICGHAEHPIGGHTFWSNADAKAAYDTADAETRNVEAAYVAEHRPY